MSQALEAKEEIYLELCQVLEIFHLLWAIRKTFFQSMELLSYVPNMSLWRISVFEHFQVHGNNLTQDDPFFISLLKNTVKKKGLWVSTSRERKEDITQNTGVLCHLKQDDKEDVATHLLGLAVPLGQSIVQYKGFFMGIFVLFPSYQRELCWHSFYTLFLGAALYQKSAWYAPSYLALTHLCPAWQLLCKNRPTISYIGMTWVLEKEKNIRITQTIFITRKICVCYSNEHKNLDFCTSGL